ncbi:hypothetical protein M3Y99_00951000 [Aphelenchoides fujianensis]|nr:hypothetical protein M3Y99_00951000 [Aphelenchoides fujianensis]
MERAKSVRDLVRQFDRQALEDSARSPLTGRNQRSAVDDAEAAKPAVEPTDRKEAKRSSGDEKAAVSVTCGHSSGEDRRSRLPSALPSTPSRARTSAQRTENDGFRWMSGWKYAPSQLIDSFVSFRVVFVGKLEFEPTADSQHVLAQAFRFALRGSDEKNEDGIDRILARFVPLSPEKVDVEVNVTRIAAFRSVDRLQPLEIHPKVVEECEVRLLEGKENAVTMIVSRLWSSKHVHVFRSPLPEALEFRAAVRQLVEMIEHNTRIEQLEWEEEWHAHNEQLDRLFADLC